MWTNLQISAILSEADLHVGCKLLLVTDMNEAYIDYKVPTDINQREIDYKIPRDMN